MGLRLIPYDTNYDFVGKKNIVLSILGVITLISLCFVFFKGFNYGIDFKGGLLLEIRTHEAADLGKLRSDLHGIVQGEVNLQEFGSPNDVLIRVERQPGGEEAQLQALGKIKEKIGANVDYRQVVTVGPKVSEDLIRNGIYAVLWSLVAMLVYIWFRFEWQFGVCSVVTLAHDAIVVLGLFSIFQLEFNETAIIAVLITVTYSINDTVVIYDRIRENLRKFKKMPMTELINHSINETLSRTILTSTTTLLSLLGLYLFGGPVIAAFSLPIIVGILAGTISSIVISAPLLLYMGIRPEVLEKEGEAARKG
jgi:preprotein translocase SecF subunit